MMKRVFFAFGAASLLATLACESLDRRESTSPGSTMDAADDTVRESLPAQTETQAPLEGPHGKPGFVTFLEDGRLWVFSAGSPEAAAFQASGELAKQVIRPGEGPGGITLKGPDSETLTAYITAVEGFETTIEDGRLWVFRSGSPEAEEFRSKGELAKHVTRPLDGPFAMTIKAPDGETIDEYMAAWRSWAGR